MGNMVFSWLETNVFTKTKLVLETYYMKCSWTYKYQNLFWYIIGVTVFQYFTQSFISFNCCSLSPKYLCPLVNSRNKHFVLSDIKSALATLPSLIMKCLHENQRAPRIAQFNLTCKYSIGIFQHQGPHKLKSARKLAGISNVVPLRWDGQQIQWINKIKFLELSSERERKKSG